MQATLTKPERCGEPHIWPPQPNVASGSLATPPAKRAKNRLAGYKTEDLKEIARAGHTKFSNHLRQGILGALKSGQALIELKNRFPHGQWKPWIKKNFNASYRTATQYMQLARGWRAIEDHGLYNDGVTLQDLLTFLANMSRNGHGKQRNQPAPTFRLRLPKAKAVELKVMAEFLPRNSDSETESEAIHRAVHDRLIHAAVYEGRWNDYVTGWLEASEYESGE